VAQLKNLTSLKVLHLHGSGVTDKGLEELKRLSQLRQLDLDRTSVTKTGVAAFRASMPKCTVTGFEDDRTVPR
jgi:hypothetical protein